MIVSAALVPHTPLLLPSVGGSARDSLKTTLAGMARLKESLTHTAPDTIVLIKTPERGRRRRSVFHIQLPQHYAVELSKFGDLVTREEYLCDTVLGAELKENLRTADIPVTYASDGQLEYTAGVPLLALCGSSPIKILVIQPPRADLKTLFAFGQRVTSTLQESPKKIVCLAAGDCAHCSKKGKKEGYEHICLPFDYMFNDAAQKKSPHALLSINRDEIATLNACAVEPTVVLRGILDALSWQSRLRSYEAPFGVGYSVIEFTL